MGKKKKRAAKQSAVCAVKGCRVAQPHTADPIVNELFRRYAEPDKLIGWVRVSLAQLHDSMVDDYNAGRHFGWNTRFRQVEELYIRTLYILFLVPDVEIPHWLSGEQPNSLTDMYKKVNDKILQGRGTLLDVQSRKAFGQFKPIDLLHNGAHANYRVMLQIAAFELSKTVPEVQKYLEHIQTYVRYLDHLQKLFEAGRDKQTVLQAITNMHTPFEEWQQRAQATSVTTSGGE